MRVSMRVSMRLRMLTVGLAVVAACTKYDEGHPCMFRVPLAHQALAHAPLPISRVCAQVIQSDVDEALRLMKMSKSSLTSDSEPVRKEDNISVCYKWVAGQRRTDGGQAVMCCVMGWIVVCRNDAGIAARRTCVAPQSRI